MNRTFVEMARCILFQGGLDNSFWAEAIHTASYLRNRCISRSLNGRSPHELWKGVAPRLGHLRTIGTEVYVLNKALGKGKFDVRGEKGVLVGYSEHAKAYRIWIPARRNIVISRDVRFLEEIGGVSDNKSNELTIDINDTNKEIYSELERESGDNITIPLIPESGADQLEEERHRAPGRPRIIRTGSRGRPRKQYHLRSTSNTSSRNQSAEGNQRKDSNEETNEGNYHLSETEAQDYQEDVDEIFYEANIVQAFSSTTEVPLNEALNGLHAKEWKDAMIEEITNILERHGRLLTVP